MRSLTNIGLEHIDANQPAPRPELGEVEQGMALEIAMEAHQDIVAMSEEIDRLSDLGVGLENLADVTASIEAATPMELQLIDLAGDLAMAGSGHDGSLLTPGLEDAAGTTVSVEGMKTIAKDIWKAIKTFVAKIWKRVDTFFHNIFGALPRLRKAMVALKDRADKMADKSIEESKTEVGSLANPLVVGNVAPANGSAIEEVLKTELTVVTGMFEVYTKCIIERGEAIKKGFKAYKPAKDWSEEQHGKAVAELFAWGDDSAKIRNAFEAKELKTKDRRFPESAEISSVDIGGNMSLFVQERVEADESGVLSKADAASSRVVRIMSTFEKSKDALEDHEMETMTIKDIQAIADVCIEIIDAVEGWERGKNIGKVKDLVKDVQSGGETLNKAYDKLDDVPNAVRPYPKAAQGFVKSFTDWTGEPYASVVKNALAAVRAAVSLCNKSLSNYK